MDDVRNIPFPDDLPVQNGFYLKASSSLLTLRSVSQRNFPDFRCPWYYNTAAPQLRR